MAKLRTLGDVREAGLAMLAVCHNKACRYTKPIDLEKLIGAIGSMQSLLPVKDQEHFSERMKCPKCKNKGMFVWVDFPKEPHPHINSALAFRLTAYDRLGERSPCDIARIGDRQIAQAAFEMAEAVYPRSRIEMSWHKQIIQASHLRMVRGGKG